MNGGILLPPGGGQQNLPSIGQQHDTKECFLRIEENRVICVNPYTGHQHSQWGKSMIGLTRKQIELAVMHAAKQHPKEAT